MPTLSERLRKQLHGTPFSPNNCPCYLCDLYREAAAELDRREAIVAAAEAWAKWREVKAELIRTDQWKSDAWYEAEVGFSNACVAILAALKG